MVENESDFMWTDEKLTPDIVKNYVTPWVLLNVFLDSL